MPADIAPSQDDSQRISIEEFAGAPQPLKKCSELVVGFARAAGADLFDTIKDKYRSSCISASSAVDTYLMQVLGYFTAHFLRVADRLYIEVLRDKTDRVVLLDRLYI